MGTIARGIIGGVSGKVGTVVGSSWKGVSTLKARPLSVAQPVTALRTAEILRLTNINLVWQLIKDSHLKDQYNKVAKKMSGYNLFIKRNKSLFDLYYPSPQANFVYSEGIIAKCNTFNIETQWGSGNIELEWSNNSILPNQHSTDVPLILLFDEQNEIALFSGIIPGITRISGGYWWNIDPLWTGINKYTWAYLMFLSADHSQYSMQNYNYCLSTEP
jgi:hypothetical protein